LITPILNIVVGNSNDHKFSFEDIFWNIPIIQEKDPCQHDAAHFANMKCLYLQCS